MRSIRTDEKPISHRGSPPQGFARSSRYAGLSRAACAPLPRRPPCEGGNSFRNNSVPEDEPMRNFRAIPRKDATTIRNSPTRSSSRWRPERRHGGGRGTRLSSAAQSRQSTRPPAIATVASTSSSSGCRRSLSHPTTRAGAAIARRPRAAGRSARAKRRRRSISTSRSRSRTKRVTAKGRRDASRSCARSRSFTPPRSMIPGACACGRDEDRARAN